jgi:hypothetical protein
VRICTRVAPIGPKVGLPVATKEVGRFADFLGAHRTVSNCANLRS